MSKAAISLDSVVKRYGDFTAVDKLSFEVPSGIIYGVLGPNGAGKTTVLRMINDILVPDEGSIKILDEHPPGSEAAKHIGYLPEERGLYPKMKVIEVLVFFGELRSLTGREARKRAMKWLERLGIGEWATNKVQDLSKGMQQKVQFISALIHEPELLILDEPWSGLDPINADVLRDIVIEQRDKGHSIVFSTHLMEQAEQICERVCIIARGSKVLEGPLDEIKRAAAGDSLVAVVFDDDATEAKAQHSVLCDRTLVRNHRERGDHLEIELAESTLSDKLLSALVSANLGIRRFEVVQPSLHQIFVDRVGEVEAAGQTEEAAGG